MVDFYVQKYNDLSQPEIIIYSVNLRKYHQWRDEGRWDLIIDDLAHISNNLKICGASIGLIATNSMHKVFDEVQAKTDLKLVHIADATAFAIRKKDIKTIGLLGTKYTMSELFYISKLEKQGLSVIVPEANEQELINDIIFKELVFGKFYNSSKDIYLKIIDKLVEKGAKGIVLGCTEIPLLINQEMCDIPLFDTAKIHAKTALLSAIKYDIILS
jgi:aspartate racemase